MYKNKEINPNHLSSWLQQNINEKELVFDKCSHIFNIIVQKLEEQKIPIDVENNVLMIKLCKYLYENSTH
jgi:hypothetical protein